MTAEPPLKPHWLHILLALAGGDRHGAGIAREVASQTDGGMRLWPVTLYRSLDELASAGFIRELEDEATPEGEPGRGRYYRLTSAGRAALAREGRRLSALAAEVRNRLGAEPA